MLISGFILCTLVILYRGKNYLFMEISFPITPGLGKAWIWLYTKGRLLKDASDASLYLFFAVIIMSAIAIVGLTYRSGDKRYKLAWDSALIFIVYIVNLIILYRLTSL